MKLRLRSLAFLAALSLVACSSASDDGPTLGGSAGARSSAGGGGGGGSPPTSGPSGVGGAAANGGVDVMLPSGGKNATGGMGGETCTADFAKTELQTVYLAFAFDVSGSMGKLDEEYHDPKLKWEPVVRASKAFFADTSSSRFRASLTFFPAEDDRCDAARYLEPDVSMTELPSDAFAKAIDDITPVDSDGWRGGTPTLAVLQGTYTFLNEQIQKDTSGKYAVVLITDGYPQGCDDDEDDIETVAKAVEGAAATLPTYVIGVENPPGGPDTVSNLERLAVAGGTNEAFLVATGDPENTARAFKGVIDSIRGQSLSCEARIPETPDGVPVNPERVNVTLSRAGALTRLGYDASCTNDGAWKFDDAANPHHIVLCDTTCRELQRDTTVDLNVEFGCERIEAVPR